MTPGNLIEGRVSGVDEPNSHCVALAVHCIALDLHCDAFAMRVNKHNSRCVALGAHVYEHHPDCNALDVPADEHNSHGGEQTSGKLCHLLACPCNLTYTVKFSGLLVVKETPPNYTTDCHRLERCGTDPEATLEHHPNKEYI